MIINQLFAKYFLNSNSCHESSKKKKKNKDRLIAFDHFSTIVNIFYNNLETYSKSVKDYTDNIP